MNHINSHTFEEHFYKFFTFKEYNKNECIINEGEKSRKIYFIYQGSIEIFIKQNILQINELTKSLLKKEGNSFEDNYQIGNNIYSIYSELKKITNFKLFLYGTNQTIGCVECFFKLDHFYQAKVVSEKCSVISIEIEHFFNIIEKDKHTKVDFESYCIIQLRLIIKRLIDVKRGMLANIDKKENENKKMIKFNFGGNKDNINNKDNIPYKINPLTTVNSSKFLKINASPKSNYVDFNQSLSPSQLTNKDFENKFGLSNFISVEDILLKKVQNKTLFTEFQKIQNKTNDFYKYGKTYLNKSMKKKRN